MTKNYHDKVETKDLIQTGMAFRNDQINKKINSIRYSPSKKSLAHYNTNTK